MAPIPITPPAAEPVTLTEARLELRLASDEIDENAKLFQMISSARQEAEHRLGRALMTQTWETVLDTFPAGAIRLDMPTVQAITSIKYIDPAGVEQTMAPGDYVLDNVNEPGFVWPAVGVTWPTTISDSVNAVRVRFTAGYGGASDVPESIRCWMKEQIKATYFNREPARFIDTLLERYRVYV